MFKIKIRITDGLDELKTMSCDFFDKEWHNVSGFVEVTIGKHILGCYYHETPLQVGEIGGQLINWWLSLFLQCAKFILSTKYVAFHEPEKANRWLEFRLIDGVVILNIALDEKQINNRLLIFEKFDDFTYVEPINYKIEIKEFLYEIDSSVKKFIEELTIINPELIKTKMVRELSKLM